MKKLIIGLGAVVVLAGSYAGASVYVSEEAEKAVEKAVKNVSEYATIRYENVWVDLLNQKTYISDIVITSVKSHEQFQVDQIIIKNFNKQTDIATMADFSINGITLDLNKHPDKTQKIIELGYQGELLLNMDVNFDYNSKKKSLNLKKLTFGIDKVADITFKLQLDGLNLESSSIIGMLMNPKFSLKNATIRYQDHSLAERLFKQAAKKEHLSVETYKKLGIESLQKLAKVEQDSFTKTALKQIILFIETPNSFSISANPEKPFPLGGFMMIKAPKDLIKQLNIKITP
ncbi:MAG: hypothetical protein KAU26_10235 [Methylococcales bacterium]|nr:hypothetical protein [Methylococcales bacterium]